MSQLQLTRIKREFPDNSLKNPEREVKKELLKFSGSVRPGDRIGIAVGSRGISNLELMVRAAVDFVKSRSARPFIIPAMGSHGGANAGGQSAILKEYGISERIVGAPVISSMDVVMLNQGNSPCPVYMDKIAFESDGVILINRIKPHTDFHAKYESGLVKMAVIGLGKEKQASTVHSFGVYGLSQMIPVIAGQVLSEGKIIGGISLVENACDKTMLIKALKADEFLKKEPELLEIARNNMPALPVKKLDILIIDSMGKDISGVGIDPNIIGRIRIMGQAEPAVPEIKSIVVLDLTTGSRGNAIGMGLSDVITKRLFDKIDLPSTYKNVITSSFLERAKVPVVADCDREAFDVARRSCGFIKEGMERIIRIKNTLHLEEILVSRVIADELEESPGIQIVERDLDMFARDNSFRSF